MRSIRLQLNASKTEVLWCASARRQDQLPALPLLVGSDAVKPVRCVRDLGIYIDAGVSMKTDVSKTVSSCFAALRQIRRVRRSASKPVLLSIVLSLVVWYCRDWTTAAPRLRVFPRTCSIVSSSLCSMQQQG